MIQRLKDECEFHLGLSMLCDLPLAE